MKETTTKLTDLINSYIEEDNLDKLNSIFIDIEKCIENLLLISNNLFTTIITTRFFNPISDHIESLNNILYSGRSGKQKEEQRIKKLNLAMTLKNKILKDYKEQFKQTDYYKEFICEKSNARDFIINPFHKAFPIEILPLGAFRKLLKDCYSKTLEYFKKQSETLDQEVYKNELVLFAEELKEKVHKLNKDIANLTEQIIKTSIDENSVYTDTIFNSEIELGNSLYHKEILEKLFEKLSSSHLVLKMYQENREIPLTVFGHRNYQSLMCFFEEMKYFLDQTVTFNDIVKVFTYKKEIVVKKLNLTNGTINDFAHLINELHPYFIEEIRLNKNYNKWWSDRFTYNQKDKNIKAISTFRSSTKSKNDSSRKSNKVSKINKIVQTL